MSHLSVESESVSLLEDVEPWREELKEEFARRLKLARLSTFPQQSQEMWAHNKFGVALKTYQRWENNKDGGIADWRMQKVADEAGFDISDLLTTPEALRHRDEQLNIIITLLRRIAAKLDA